MIATVYDPNAQLLAQLRADRLRAKRERRERDEEAAALESSHGARLDALSDGALLELARVALLPHDVGRYRPRYRTDPTARLFLLRRLAQTQTQTKTLPGESNPRNPSASSPRDLCGRGGAAAGNDQQPRSGGEGEPFTLQYIQPPRGPRRVQVRNSKR